MNADKIGWSFAWFLYSNWQGKDSKTESKSTARNSNRLNHSCTFCCYVILGRVFKCLTLRSFSFLFFLCCLILCFLHSAARPLLCALWIWYCYFLIYIYIKYWRATIILFWCFFVAFFSRTSSRAWFIFFLRTLGCIDNSNWSILTNQYRYWSTHIIFLYINNRYVCVCFVFSVSWSIAH